MRPLPDVQAEILDAVGVLAATTVGLRDAYGLALVEDVVAGHDLPPFANSAMDGYAVRAADVAEAPVDLPVVEEVAAGAVPTKEVTEGTAVKIMTGAPLPAGADTIVKVEDTEPGAGAVRVLAGAEKGTSVRPAGGDVAAGTTVLTAGERLGSAHLGVLAALGVAWPPVRRRPTVAIMSTGDEVVAPETATLGPGKIRDANRFLLRGMLHELGAVVVDFGIVADDPDDLRRVLEHAAQEADVVVTSGGVSMGEYDVVKQVFAGVGDVAFHRVAMQPAKPLGFGRIAGKPFFGLPGNPVSVVVAFEQFLRPALLAMMGCSKIFRSRIPGRLVEPVATDPDKAVFLRVVTLDVGTDGWSARLSGGQSSNVLSALAAADAFAVIPVGTAGVAAGDRVELEMFRWPEGRTRKEVLGG
ncbi:MAG TPA: gephyrin-like molybdotransferase Glp [Acidimicrobiia bacterium]